MPKLSTNDANNAAVNNNDGSSGNERRTQKVVRFSQPESSSTQGAAAAAQSIGGQNQEAKPMLNQYALPEFLSFSPSNCVNFFPEEETESQQADGPN